MKPLFEIYRSFIINYVASETCSCSDGEENSLAVVWAACRQGAVRNAKWIKERVVFVKDRNLD